MQLKSVVLPAPFGPISPTIWPGATSKDTPSSATMPPKRTQTSCTRSNACAGAGSIPPPPAAFYRVKIPSPLETKK